MISINNTRRISQIPFAEMKTFFCEQIVKLFTLAGKYQDDDKVKMWGDALATDMPVKFGWITPDQLSQIFKNAITGDYGDLKSLTLTDVFRWVRKWLDGQESGQKALLEPMASANTLAGENINWSKEVYKAYQRYLTNGLQLDDFSHFIYDRMMVDNMIEKESYQAKLEKAESISMENGIVIAKKMVVINRFEECRRAGKMEIYGGHKND